MTTLEMKADELRKKSARASFLAEIYSQVYGNQKWLGWTSELDENGDNIIRKPEKQESDGYYLSDYDKWEIYDEVLKAIEKLA